METLIRNKLPIACLVAALAIAWLGGLFSGSTPGPVSLASLDRPHKPRPMADDAEPAPFRSPVPLAAAHSIAAWRSALLTTAQSISRIDPFAEPPNAAVDTLDAQTADRADIDPDTLALQGISISGNQAYVVVDRQLLTVGDALGSWSITAIQADGIHLQNAKGAATKSIPWNRPPATNNAATASARNRAFPRTPVQVPTVPEKN